MNTCPDEDRIGRYLTGRLSEREAEEIEEHYFNCPLCFRKISERSELVDVIRKRGAEIFEGTVIRPQGRASLGKKIAAVLVWKHGIAAAAAAVLLIVALALIPEFTGRGPALVSTGDETVRSETLALLSPLGEAKAAPASFEWKALRAAAEYHLSVSGPETLWSTITAATKAELPENIRGGMKPGSYRWQVKAYSAQGALLSASGEAEFRIVD